MAFFNSVPARLWVSFVFVLWSSLVLLVILDIFQILLIYVCVWAFVSLKGVDLIEIMYAQIPEDLHFVLRMRHTFESLGYQSGFYLSQLFSSTRNTSSSSSLPSKQSTIPSRPPPPIFNWGQRSLPSATSMLASPNFQNSARLGFPHTKDETHMFLLPHSSETRIEDIMADHENDIKWPNGLSFYNALTGRSDDAKLLFSPEGLGNKPDQNHHPLILEGKNPNPHSDSNPNEFLSLDSHPETVRKMENKFKRSFTLPARMASSSSSTSLDHHQHHPVEYRNSEAGMYPDVMETFLEWSSEEAIGLDHKEWDVVCRESFCGSLAAQILVLVF